jgi:signal transduction histidine kinase
VSLILSKNVLTIKDTGIGIKKEEHEKIFDRFYQSSTVRSKE